MLADGRMIVGVALDFGLEKEIKLRKSLFKYVTNFEMQLLT